MMDIILRFVHCFVEMVQPNHVEIDVGRLMKDVMKYQGPTQFAKGNSIACGSGEDIHFIAKEVCRIVV